MELLTFRELIFLCRSDLGAELPFNDDRPYLAAGFISRRQCLREVYKISGSKALPTERESGLGMWVQEVAGWGDFYTHVSYYLQMGTEESS